MTFVVHLLVFICLAEPLLGEETGWQNEWNGLVARARQEGRVTVIAPPDPETRVELPARFKARFGIDMEYIGGSFGGGLARKLILEHQAGVYSADVVLGGVDSMATVTYPEKLHDPLRPVLILPDVLDSSKWKAEKLWFMDPPQQYILRLFNTLTTLLGVNTLHVKSGEIQSFKDVLNPKWKGKMSVYDPTVSGKGGGFAAFLLDSFGERFVRQLYIDQHPVVSRSDRQITDWLARGTYPVAIGPAPEYTERLRKEGFPVVTVSQLADMPGKTNGASGFVTLMNRAPHPNAARVFINWIASKEGLEVYARSQLAVPLRNDVDESYLPDWRIPRAGVKYWDSSSWDYNLTRKQVLIEQMVEIMKGRNARM
jgi:iron(III) transport system substrate-binding protein